MLFEPYVEFKDGNHPPPLTDVLIRPASPADVRELSEMEAAREGGEAAARAPGIERSIVSAAATGQELILVAQYGNRLAGLAKTRHFDPLPDAPSNAAPRGWYLSGIIVVPEFRRRGIGDSLTRSRLEWIGRRDDWAYYFANARNRVSLVMHERFGFVELTRDFSCPGASFEGGVGILFRARVAPPFAAAGGQPRSPA